MVIEDIRCAHAEVAGVMQAKEDYLGVSSLPKEITGEHNDLIRIFALLGRGNPNTTDQSPTMMDLAEGPRYSQHTALLTRAYEAKHTYGVNLLNAIPKIAVGLFNLYLHTEQEIDTLTADLQSVIPQRYSIDTLRDTEAQQFLQEGSRFDELYAVADEALGKLARKLRYASRTRLGDAHTRNRDEYQPIDFTRHVLAIRDTLRQEKIVAEGAVAPMTAKNGQEFMRQVASAFGVDFDNASDVTLNTLMTALGFFTYEKDGLRETWYGKNSPVANLYALWAQENEAMDVFRQAREEGDSRIAYFALSRVATIQAQAQHIREGVRESIQLGSVQSPRGYRRTIARMTGRAQHVVSQPLQVQVA